MKILALIPARGGSKRLPGKNIKNLSGKPLIIWSVEALKGIDEICCTLVSTDDEDIANVCKKEGVSVPWLRPPGLATDLAGSVDVAIHALDWYESQHGVVNGLLLLQPTSPFRSPETIRKGLELFKSNPSLPVLGVSKAQFHPQWMLKQDGLNLLKPYFSEEVHGGFASDLPIPYVVNGSFYLISPELLRTSRTFVGKVSQPLFSSSFVEDIDIDDEEDWVIAEAFANRFFQKNTDFEDRMRAPDLKSDTTALYLAENKAAFSLPKQILNYHGQPRKVEIASISGIAKRKMTNALLAPLRYMREIFLGWEEIARLSAAKGSKKDRKAIVIGNGPSQGLISAEMLKKFSDSGNDIYAVNFWDQNEKLSIVPPQYLVISDPVTLAPEGGNLKQRASLITRNKSLLDYLLAHTNIKIFSPVNRVDYLKSVLGPDRIIGFVDTEMQPWTSNIDPRYPRGYLSMTLFKALALAIHMGYKKIYLVGMDNTYPRDIFCGEKNQIFNLERHAGGGDYLLDQTALIPSMDVWAQDMFKLFYDMRRCFSGAQVLNLDCYSLTDIFPKVSSINEINDLF